MKFFLFQTLFLRKKSINFTSFKFLFVKWNNYFMGYLNLNSEKSKNDFIVVNSHSATFVASSFFLN